MSEFRFKPEDFTDDVFNAMNEGPAKMSLFRVFELVCWRANARLAEMIAEAPVVYSVREENPLSEGGAGGVWFNQPGEGDAHSARLICIEEIKP